MADHKIAYEFTFDDGATITVGQTFQVLGEKGRVYRFIKAVDTGEALWLDGFGGSASRQQSRSVEPARVNTASIKTPAPKKKK